MMSLPCESTGNTLLYITTHSKLVVVNDKHGFTFNVACVLPFNNEVGMKANVLYCSRMYHPVINAVGIFKRDDGFLLVFIYRSQKASIRNIDQKYSM